MGINKINNINKSSIIKVNSKQLDIDSNTKLLLNFNEPDGSRETIDSGNTGHVITQNGTGASADNNIISTTEKKFGNSSGYFNGTAYYLSALDHADWDILTQTNFTIDFWIKFTDHADTEYLIAQEEDAQNRWFMTHTDGQGFGFFASSGGASIINTGRGGEITDTDWHHVALIKVGNDYGIYVDGTQVVHTNDSDTDTFAASLEIGRYAGADYYFNGYIDDLRITHSNIFSASPNSTPDDTITVPTSSLSSDANTKLLLHFETIDNSNENHIPKFYGSAEIDTTQKKFGSSSLLLDGDSDYLSIPDSDDWDLMGDLNDSYTIDGFIYLNNNDKNQVIFGQYYTSNEYYELLINSSNHLEFNYIRNGTIEAFLTGGKIDTNQWYHFALVKNGQNLALYLDGTQVGYFYFIYTRQFADNFTIGRNDNNSNNYFDGYIDSFRIIKDNFFDVTSEEKLLYRHYKLNDDSDNTNVSDNSSHQAIGTATDNTEDLTITGKINKALNFNGSDQYVTLDSNMIFDYSGPITVCFWVYTETLSGSSQYAYPVQLKTNNSTYGIGFMISSTGSYNGLNIGSDNNGMPARKTTKNSSYFTNNWVHVALVYDGITPNNINSYKLYIDNSLETWTSTGGWGSHNNTNWLGRGNGASNYFDGRIDDFRVYKTALSSDDISNIYNSGSGTEDEPSATVFAEPNSEYKIEISKILGVSNQ